jgi:hypothetical protein
MPCNAESECGNEIEKRESLATEQCLVKQALLEERRKTVQFMKNYLEIEKRANQFEESALMIDSSSDYTRGWRL